MAQDTAHKCARRVGEGRETTNDTPWVGCSAATQQTHRASGRSGTRRPLARSGKAASETMTNVTWSHGSNQ